MDGSERVSWCSQQDLNLRPWAYEAPALTAMLWELVRKRRRASAPLPFPSLLVCRDHLAGRAVQVLYVVIVLQSALAPPYREFGPAFLADLHDHFTSLSVRHLP